MGKFKAGLGGSGTRLWGLVLASVATIAGTAAPAGAQSPEPPPPPPPSLSSLSVDPPALLEDGGDVPVTVTAGGNTNNGAMTLALTLRAGSASACEATLSGTPAASSTVVDAFTGEQLSLTVPTATQGTFTVCGYLGPDLLRTATVTVQPPANNLSLTAVVQNPPGAVQGGRIDVEARFSSSRPRMLFLYQNPQGGQCASTPQDEVAAGATAVGDRQGFPQFEPATAWRIVNAVDITAPNVRICAYVGEHAGEAESGPLQGGVTGAGVPTVTGFALATSAATGIEDRAMTVSGSGSLPFNVQRTLYLYARPVGHPVPACGASPQHEAMAGATLLGGPRTVANDFRADQPFAPPASGRWLLCAYVTGAQDQQADPGGGPVSKILDVRPPTGSFAIDVPGGLRIGEASTVVSRGTVEAPRGLHVIAGPDRQCGATADAEARRGGVGSLTPGDGDLVGPDAFEHQRPVIVGGTDPVRFCAYLAKRPTSPPDAVATALVAPVQGGGTGGGGTGGGGTGGGSGGGSGKTGGSGSGGGTAGEEDVSRAPASVGKRSQGSFWVNNTVMPAGVTAARFVEIARRAGEYWGYKYRGVTSRGAAKRDKRRVIGFSAVVRPAKVGSIVVFKQRLKRPKGCGKRQTGRCRVRYKTLEREIALARRLTGWWQGPEHPPADAMDVESVLLRLFGVLAGNEPDQPACSGSVFLRSTGVTTGWWWRGPQDTFRPRCATQR